MVENDARRTLLQLDAHDCNRWTRITMLTDHEFLTAGVESHRRDKLLNELSSSEDPLQILMRYLPPKHDLMSIPLRDLESVQCYSDEPITTIEYYDSQKLKHCKTTLNLSSVHSQTELLNSIRTTISKSDFSEVPAGVMYTGGQQIVYGVMAILIFGGVAIVGHYNPGPAKLDRIQRGRALGELYNTMGPTGFIAIGVAIVLSMVIWWAIKCRKPPLKSTLRIHRDSL